MSEQQTELVVIKKENVLAAFISKDGVDPILQEAHEHVRGFEPDLSTDKGRKAIASLAHQVSKFKVRLDDMGKEVVAEEKKKIDAVNASRKHLRDSLDTLRDETRQPLTDWENTETRRVAKHQGHIEDMQATGMYVHENWMTHDLDSMSGQLEELEAIKIDDSWEEFANQAAIVRDTAISALKVAIEQREKHDAEQAELEKFRTEEDERERLANEERIRQEATAAAERKAKAEAERLEQEKKDAVARAERAEEQAKVAAENARLAEIKRQDDAAADAIAEQKRLEANTQHIGKIRKEAKEALMKYVDEPTAKKIVLAINAGAIPNVSIKY